MLEREREREDDYKFPQLDVGRASQSEKRERFREIARASRPREERPAAGFCRKSGGSRGIVSFL